MASYFFSPLGNSQLLSTTGAPLSAGTITTFQAGTSTPQATYTDNVGSSPSTSLTLNTYGLPSSPVWLKGGQSYKFVIKDSLGNTIRTIDTVSGIGDPIVVGADGQQQFLTGVSGTNTVVGTAANILAYRAGQKFTFLPAVSNTGAATLNINALGALAITKFGGTALSPGDLRAGAAAVVDYDGSAFQLENPLPLFSLGASGYQILPSGEIMQWGSGTTLAGTGTATFATAFPTACRSIIVNESSAAAWTATNLTVYGVSAVSTTTATVKSFTWGGASFVAAAGNFYYIAFGS